MAKLNEDQQWLLDNLKAGGLEIADANDFASLFNNKEDAKWAYENAVRRGLKVGNFEEFVRDFNPNGALVNNEPAQVNQAAINKEIEQDFANLPDYGSPREERSLGTKIAQGFNAVSKAARFVGNPIGGVAAEVGGLAASGEIADWGKTALNSAGSAIVNFGAKMPGRLVDEMGSLTPVAMPGDGKIATTPYGMPYAVSTHLQKGASYDEKRAAADRVANGTASKEDYEISSFTRKVDDIEKLQEKLSKNARPEGIAEDEGFLDLLSRGSIENAFQLGLGTAIESAPATAMAVHPVGAVALGALSAADEYDTLTKEHPEIGEVKRAAAAIGYGTIEQAVEQWFNPFKGMPKGAIRGILKSIEQGAGKLVRRSVLKQLGKSTVEEGLEEIATQIGDDAWYSALDAMSGERELGYAAQYEQFKKENPKADDSAFFAKKGKELVDSFIGGAMGGLFMGGGRMAYDGKAISNSVSEQQAHLNNANMAISGIAAELGTTRENVADVIDSANNGTSMNLEGDQDIIRRFNYKMLELQTIDERVNMTADHIANKDDDNVYAITNHQGTFNGHIIRGNVVLDEEGNFDLERSDNKVTVIGADGKAHSVALASLSMTNEAMSKQDYIATDKAREMARIQAQKTFKVGDKVYLTENGRVVEDENPSEVVANENGEVTVTTQNEDGSVTTQTIDAETANANMTTEGAVTGVRNYVNTETGAMVSVEDNGDGTSTITDESGQEVLPNEDIDALVSAGTLQAAEQETAPVAAAEPTATLTPQQQAAQQYQQAVGDLAQEQIVGDLERQRNSIPILEQEVLDAEVALEEANQALANGPSAYLAQNNPVYAKEHAQLVKAQQKAQERVNKANDALEKAKADVEFLQNAFDGMATPQQAATQAETAAEPTQAPQVEEVSTEETEEPVEENEQPAPKSAENILQAQNDLVSLQRGTEATDEEWRDELQSKLEEACPFPVRTVTIGNIIDGTAAAMGMSAETAKDIMDIVNAGGVVQGYYDPDDNMTFVVADSFTNGSEAAVIVQQHEGLHEFVANNAEAQKHIQELANNNSLEQLIDMLKALGASEEYEKRYTENTQINRIALAEEVAAHVSEKAAREGKSPREIMAAAGISNQATRTKIQSIIDGNKQRIKAGTPSPRRPRTNSRTNSAVVGNDEQNRGRGSFVEGASNRPANRVGSSVEELNAEITDAVTGGIETEGGKSTGRFSISAILEGAGLVAKDNAGNPIVDEQGNVRAFLDGKAFDGNNPIRVEDLKSVKNSVLNYMIEDAVDLGYLSQDKADKLYAQYVEMINAALEKGLASNGGAGQLTSDWQWLGETIYKTVATNGDSQYAYSLDITRVCKKNKAVINSISAMQRKLGYGITPGQIMDIYMQSEREGYQVPCPVCYVFSRYIRNGKYASAAINGMQKYGEHLGNGSDPWTVKQWVDELNRIEAVEKKYEKDIKKAKDDVALILEQIDVLATEVLSGRLNPKILEGYKADIARMTAEIESGNLNARMEATRRAQIRGIEGLIKKATLTKEDIEARRQKIEELDARYRAALNVTSQESLKNWIKSFALQAKSSAEYGFELRADSEKPADMKDFAEHALDLRLTADAMRKYPAIQRLRKSGGASAGKEITYEANNGLGEVAMMLGAKAAVDNANDESKQYNYYQAAADAKTNAERTKMRAKARERLKDAHNYAQQQTLRGGQRMWSWSDNIEKLAPDVFINMMQLEMIGGALQSYSKQLEGINMVATMGGYVNGSLMGRGNGYTELKANEVKKVGDNKFVYVGEDITYTDRKGKKHTLVKSGAPAAEVNGRYYTLAFDDVVGIDPYGHGNYKGLFDLNNKLDKAGNILVGMNDLHIELAMADDRVFFIIPWHASGGSTHILAQMLEYLGVNTKDFKPRDYTNVQEEKHVSTVSAELAKLWEKHKNETDYACGIRGGIESGRKGKLSPSQIHYKALRDAIFVDDTLEQDKARMREIMDDEFLKQVYRKVRGNANERFVDSARMTKGDTEHIYPYEYWNESSDYSGAKVNGKRYVEYCRRLGVKPKFCGKLDSSKGDYGNFIDHDGYWKLLIDRRMYGVDGKFQDLNVVEADNFTPALADPQQTKNEFDVTLVTDDEGAERIADKTIRMEENRVGHKTEVDFNLDMETAVRNYRGVSAGRFSVANKNQEIFVSNAARAVEKVKQDKATPAQWLAMIAKGGGIKEGEDKWMGLSDWLKESTAKTLTKDEVMQFVRNNAIQIEEVKYGENVNTPDSEEVFERFREFLADMGYDEDETEEIIDNSWYSRESGIDTNYHQDALLAIVEDFNSSLRTDAHGINHTRLRYTTDGLTNKREIALTVPTIEPWNESDKIHFGDAGEGRAIGWIRFGETTDTNGDNTLVIDEIQSKRHQEGREKGYKPIKPISPEDANRAFNDYYWNYIKPKYGNAKFSEWSKEDQNKYQELDSQRSSSMRIIDNRPSDAPFDKNWMELCFKRMLRLAAEEGYDRVAWTSGKQQAERYGLGGVVNRIKVDGVTYVDGTKSATAYLKSGDDISISYDKEGIISSFYGANQYNEYIGKRLSDVFGIGIEEEILSTPDGTEQEISNVKELPIGGKGMESFYDQMLPSYVKKYTKKWGATVEDVTLPNVEEAGRVMHSVNITPEMKESVMRGQVMFSIKGSEPKWSPKRRLDEYTYSVDDEHKQMVADVLEEYDNGEIWSMGDAIEELSYRNDDADNELLTLIERYNDKADYAERYDGREHDEALYDLKEEAENALRSIVGEPNDPNGGRFSVRKDESAYDFAKRVVDGQNKYSVSNSFEKEAEANGRFSLVSNRNEIARLEREPKIKVFRSMQLIDGKLYPPMSLYDFDGKMREPQEIGKWYRSDEDPDAVNKGTKSSVEKGKVDLFKRKVRGRKDGVNGVVYAPYFHGTTSPLNDQFANAYDRPELVTVEMEIPASELKGDYQAEGSPRTTGEHEWPMGVVSRQLPSNKGRKVILSRWGKITRVVPDSEVARIIVDYIGNDKVVFPYNVVNPKLRAELEKRGVEFTEERVGNDSKDERVMNDYRERLEEARKEVKLQEEKKELQNVMMSWLSDENVDWAEGKSLSEVSDRFGNDPKPVAIIPDAIRKFIPSLNTDYLYCGKAYLIDHAANHHPELEIDEYSNIQKILDSYDDIKDLTEGNNVKVAIVKKIGKQYAVVAELSKENNRIILHKTFFYRDSDGKRVPYKNKKSIFEVSSVDGSTTINPTNSSRQTPNISALDDFNGKVTTKFSTDKILEQKNAKKAEKSEDFVKSEQGRYSISAKQDEDYRKAVESGDMETAAKMVREAAAKAGYTTEAFHGAEEGGFNTFDNTKRRNTNAIDGAYHFFADEDNAYTYRGSNGETYHTFLNMGKTLVVEGYGADWMEIGTEYEAEDGEEFATLEEAISYSKEKGLNVNMVSTSKIEDTNEIAERAKKDGYDSVHIKNVLDPGYHEGDKGVRASVTDEYIVFSPNQIKSADPATYDDKGNLIPLSERFNEKNNDIRFSIKSNTKEFKDAAAETFSKYRLGQTADIDAIMDELESINSNTIKNKGVEDAISEMRSVWESFDIGDSMDSRDEFVDELEARVLTAVNNSGRFSIISPKEKLLDVMIDGSVNAEVFNWYERVVANGGIKTGEKNDDGEEKVIMPILKKQLRGEAESYSEEYTTIYYESLDELIEDYDNYNLLGVGEEETPYVYVSLAFKEGYVDKDGDLNYSDGELTPDDVYEYLKDAPEGVQYNEPISEDRIKEDSKSNIDNKKREDLEHAIANSAKSIFPNKVVVDGQECNVDCSRAFKKKYSFVDIENEDGDLVGRVQLRLADHSYNPANNDYSAKAGNFISVVLTDKDKTADRFHGAYNLKFALDSEVDEIKDAISKRFSEIVEGWNDNNKGRFSIAYHGSGADFSKFDMSFANSGTGDMIYGYGVYVTDNESIGKDYAELNTKEGEGNRKLYTVDIPDDNGRNYFDWEKTYSKAEVAKIGNKVIDAMLADPENEGMYKESDRKNMMLDYGFDIAENGGSLYGAISAALGSDKAASEFMRAQGFVGNKIPVGYTTGDERKGTNYVIYDENDVKITKKGRFSVKQREENDYDVPELGDAESISDYEQRLAKYTRDELEKADLTLEGMTYAELAEQARLITADLNRDNAIETAKALKTISSRINALRDAKNLQRAYDKTTVRLTTNLAKMLIRHGWADGISAGELNRVLRAIQRSNGSTDITPQIDLLLDAMARCQQRKLEKLWKKVITPVRKLNTNRIEVARGVLGNEAEIINNFNKFFLRDSKGNMRFDAAAYAEMKELATDKLGEDNLPEATRKMYENQMDAIALCDQYMAGVESSRSDIFNLEAELNQANQELKGLKGSEREMKKKHIEDLRTLLRDANMQLIDSYIDVIKNVSELRESGHSAYKDFVEARKERKARIIHYMNSDLEGVKPRLHEEKVSKLREAYDTITDGLASPLHTMLFELKKFARHAPEGKGYLYEHFANGIIQASENERIGLNEAKAKLDAKAQELFGMDWIHAMNEFGAVSTRVGLSTCKVMTGKAYPISAGQLMYLYMVNKMADGRMKMEAMNFEQDDIDLAIHILATDHPKLKELADWLQDDFLPGLRGKYNETYKRMFGVSMPVVKNYAPLKIEKSSIQQDVEVGNPSAENQLPSTVTGNIMKRSVNTKPIDFAGTNAMELMLEHINTMEHWNAYAEITQDVNTLLSSRGFRNKINGMYRKNFKIFFDAAKIATGNYQSNVGTIHSALNVLTKMIGGAKVSLRFQTAFKQILSLPAFLDEVSLEFYKTFFANTAHPVNNFKWCVENLPLFEKRWNSKLAGNEKLMLAEGLEGDAEKSMQWLQDHFIKYGMTANSAVDAITCALGAKSMYDYKKKLYMKQGFAEDVADSRAKKDAEIAYNETQQSSEGLMMSKIQSDRDFVSTSVSLFNNSSFAYGRKFVEGIHEARKIARDNGQMEEFRKKQLVRQGLTEEQAAIAAKDDMKRAKSKAYAQIAIFGFGIQLAWNIGGAMYAGIGHMIAGLAGGGDPEEEENFWLDTILKSAIVQPVRGFVFGSTFDSLVSKGLNIYHKKNDPAHYGKYNSRNNNWAGWIGEQVHPAVGDYADVLDAISESGEDRSMLKVANMIIRVGTSTATGIDPQTLSNMMYALYDLVDNAKDGEITWTDIYQDFGLFVNAPGSQVKGYVLQPRPGESMQDVLDRYIRYKKLQTYGTLAPFASDMRPTDGDKKKVKEAITSEYKRNKERNK